MTEDYIVLMLLITMLTVLCAGVYRIVCIDRLYTEMVSFVFHDGPNGEWPSRLKWYASEIPDFDYAIKRFWVLDINFFVRGTYKEEFHQWQKKGRPEWAKLN